MPFLFILSTLHMGRLSRLPICSETNSDFLQSSHSILTGTNFSCFEATFWGLDVIFYPAFFNMRQERMDSERKETGKCYFWGLISNIQLKFNKCWFHKSNFKKICPGIMHPIRNPMKLPWHSLPPWQSPVGRSPRRLIKCMQP